MSAMHFSLRPRQGRRAAGRRRPAWVSEPLISDAEIAADLFYGRDQDPPRQVPARARQPRGA